MWHVLQMTQRVFSASCSQWYRDSRAGT